jgi:hypothetical protein
MRGPSRSYAMCAVTSRQSLASPDQSSAEVLGLWGTVLADRLTVHVVREIAVRGSLGGSLEPLGAQLNHDVTHLQGQRLEGIVGNSPPRSGTRWPCLASAGRRG